MADRLGSVILTGASGFVGRHLLESLSSEYRVFAIARRSQYEAAVPEHPNVAWLRADVRDKDSVGRAFREIRAAGGADQLIHLAAYYDFTGGNHENYQETNVTGTRHIIDEALGLDLDRFVFASSIAACRFPRLGEALTEASPPDGDYPYAISKRLGEQMVRDVAQRMPSVIVRLGAVYSDWCEYAPLFIFLNTWLSDSWRANILGGRGDSAVPYVHVRDIVSFFRRLLAFDGELEPAEVLQASTNGAVSHTELFELATRHYYGAARKPTRTPRLVAALGLHVLWWFGVLTRNPPFERPWMSRYIDGRLTVDNRKTCDRLGWQPHPRHKIERRVPFMVERLKSEPNAWHLRNREALMRGTPRPELAIYDVLSRFEHELPADVVRRVHASDASAGQGGLDRVDAIELQWYVRLLYRLLLTSLHHGNRMLILNYFELAATRRFDSGFTDVEIVRLLDEIAAVARQRLRQVPKTASFQQEVHDYVQMPIEFGKDEAQHQYRAYVERKGADDPVTVPPPPRPASSAREQLEDTIWSCLVHRV